MAKNEASDGARPPRGVAASGRFFLSVPAINRKLSLLGSLGRAGAAPKPHAASSDGDTDIKLLSESSPGWRSCGLEGKERWNIGFATALIFFEAPWAVYSVVGAVGPRAAAAPVALPLEIGGSRLSETVDDKAQVCMVCLGFMEHARSSWTNSPN